MIFNFVVRRLRWLARIPLLPHVFDAALLIATTLWNRPKLLARELFERDIGNRANIRFAPHRLGGIGFFLGDAEIGHLHGNGLLDLFVGKSGGARLVTDGVAEPHHVFAESGWISFWLNRPNDVVGAIRLFDRAFEYRAEIRGC
jgi:hypothetical protein